VKKLIFQKNIFSYTGSQIVLIFGMELSSGQGDSSILFKEIPDVPVVAAQERSYNLM